MRLALVADLHGNRPATEALERDLARRGADAVWCLGDVIGKGPSNDFTCDWAFEHCDELIAGNWDVGVARQAFAADSYYWKQLGEERMARLRALPMEKELWMSGRRIRFLHGRPLTGDLLTPQMAKEEIEPFLLDGRGGRYDALIYADIHRQAMRTLKDAVLVNVGSVGNALGLPRACYALLEGEPGREPADFEIRLVQLEYDRERAARDAMEARELRHREAFRDEVLTGVYGRGTLPPEVLNEAKP